MKSAGQQGSSVSLERETKPSLKGKKGTRKMSTRRSEGKRDLGSESIEFEHAMPTFL